MQIQGSPFKLSTALADLPGLSERFWYWQGASGRKYIHSVYETETCPPLPGAVFVGVKRQGPMRIALHVGRFPALWQSHQAGYAPLREFDELHVHLLARAPGEPEQVLDDLRLALGEGSDEASSFECAGADDHARPPLSRFYA